MDGVTEGQVQEVVSPELAALVSFLVGGKTVYVRPLKRRWQRLFYKEVLPYLAAELSATEDIQRAAESKQLNITNFSETIINSEIEMNEKLDRCAAIIMASGVIGAEADPEKSIKEQYEFIQDNSNEKELRDLVEAQAAKEKVVERVGERLPARWVRSARLVGDERTTLDTVKQLLSSSSPKSPEPTGAGS